MKKILHSSRLLSRREKVPRGGFALISTLSIVVLLAFIAVALLSLSSLSLRQSGGTEAREQAQVNAKLGLMTALNELQATMGPDQRISSPAALYVDDQNGRAPSNGAHRWVGVWDTSGFDPSDPDTTKDAGFVKWLVSTQNAKVALTDAAAGAVGNTHQIFTGAGAMAGADDVIVETVPVTSPTGRDGSYAYWVEDEGVKAALNWNEGVYSSGEDELAQAARLSSSPGIDPGVFISAQNGVTNAVLTQNYPLAKEDENGASTFVQDMMKASSLNDVALASGINTGDFSAWQQEFRHHLTTQSKAVLCDVKNGGLRKDLSLAFEMDGDAEAENATNFNKQTGVFVGSGNSSDPLSAPNKAIGLPTYERFLWRDWNGAGNLFSSDINTKYDGRPHRDKSVMRGPSWWALRDYANLYKRLTLSGGEYTMEARPYFPNRSTERYAYSDFHSPFGIGQTWDREYTEGNPWTSSNDGDNSKSQHYLFRPARPNYAPVNLGVACMVGLQAESGTGSNAKLAISIDPYFYFWNPYNRNIKCENIVVTLGRGIPGRVLLEYNGEKKDLNLHTVLKNNLRLANKIGENIIYLIKGPFTLKPGEVVIAQALASSGDHVGAGEAELGYTLGKDTGIIMTNLAETVQNKNRDGTYPDPVEITLPLGTEVGMVYVQSGHNAGASSHEVRHEMDTSLADSTATLSNLISSLKDNIGEQTQHNLHVLWSGTKGPATYVSDKGAANNTTVVKKETVQTLTQSKNIFGAHAILIAPSSDGAENAEPFEMFARLNPAPILMNRDYYNWSFPNQIYRHVTANSEFEVRNQMGIDFSGAVRNTFWGLSYQNTGSTSVPFSNIPSSPLLSLVDFSHANLSINSTDPFHAVGNSLSNPVIAPSSPFGRITYGGDWNNTMTTQDFSWLINDALFDGYFLSGIAPDFTFVDGGYAKTGSINATLNAFYGGNVPLAKANPALEPYFPAGATTASIVNDLDPAIDPNTDGYKRVGAYSMINGAFNINSTSVAAWEAFLRSNKGLEVDYANGGSDTDASETPFPSSGSPIKPGNGAKDHWSGLARLSDAEITTLAQGIVNQVKLRGPFMSISEFVNHKLGTIDNDRSYTGAIQAALDLDAGLNSDARNAAKNGSAVDADAQNGKLAVNNNYFRNAGPTQNRTSTTGIPGDITQADILRPLAPKISARSDTFKITAYGEVQNALGNVVATATCEAIVQRVPEYVDSAGNTPWDDSSTPLNALNTTLGRKFKIVSFNWL